MITFNFNSSDGEKCPLCNSAEVKEATLVPNAGTKEGYNAQAIQVHVQCLREQLWYYPFTKSFIAIPKDAT